MRDRITLFRSAPFLALGAALVLALLPANQSNAQTAPPAANANSTEQLEEVVVTGSILRRTQSESPSPITVVSAENLDQRGQTTVQDAIQSLTANNGPALTNSFTANGAFAGGASAVSLRGLSTNSTLVLFDGMRAAYYPLADDGTRNFVDLNTIQDDIVDRIEILRDGASSSYGADAIAGVVNVITKRQFTGLSFRAEGGQSSRSDAKNERFSVMAGHGDLGADGFNAYFSAFWEHSDSLKNSDRPYPYNSFDQSHMCFGGECGPDLRVNGFNPDGSFGGFSTAATTLYVRPYDAANTTPQGRYQFLNPTTGCRAGTTPYQLTAGDLAASASAPLTACTEDRALLYDYILPEITRFGISARATMKVGSNSEAYGQFNFLQSTVSYWDRTPVIRALGPTGILYPAFRDDAGPNILTLPIWVCPERVNCDTSPQGQLNPNNPFAAAGEVARLIGRLPDGTLTNDATRERVYRFAGGIKGTLFKDWDYNVGLTAMHNDLLRTSNGYVYIQHLLDVVADGTYNFVDPTQNSKSMHDYLFPTDISTATSDLYQWQATVRKSLMPLPGGPLQLGLGVSQYYEAVDAPSFNPDYNGPTQRYFVLNAFGTKGNRNASSAFFELDAPFTKMIEGSVAGRYDRYSTGQTHFSPKVGVKFTPIKQLAVRATYSEGFRIPSIAEASGLPTTGYVSVNSGTFPDVYLANFGCTQATFASCPGYITGATIGETTLSSASLKPEKSRSYTFGVIIAPLENVSLTIDYYDIKKSDAITNQTYASAIDAYYNGQTIPAGFLITPDAPDVNNPTVLPRISTIAAGFVNANTVTSKGIDFAVTGTWKFSAIKWTSALEGSYIRELNTTFPDGHTEHYAGTLGNFNLTAGSGTPRWHGNWENTVSYGKYSGTLTMNYFGGYNLSAEDQGSVAGDCSLSPYTTYCDVGRYVTWDLVGSADVTKNITVYLNVINLTDRLPPYDPVTYGANNYNPVQGGEGIVGRNFRLGLKAKF
jgi:iron complex outermembrane receptor protein